MLSVSMQGTNPGAAPVASTRPQVQLAALDSKDLCPLYVLWKCHRSKHSAHKSRP